MKKSLLLLLLLLSTILTACQEQSPYDVDCERFPTHADCLEEPPSCDDGYVLSDGECVPQIEECGEGYIEYEGECVVEPLICDTGFIDIDGECVFDNASLGDYLDIYYLNDMHGALTPDSDTIGMSYIANLINTRKDQSPDNVLFIAGGDMLQGTALSNYYDGLSTINLLNAAQLDAFAVGNHEFDWGLDVVLEYADGDDTNGEASFPFLGANIFQKSDDSLPDGIEPYTIIELGDRTIGIIGTIGYGLEYSIATSKVDPYYFSDPVPIVAYYAEHLRTVEDCDVVIVAAHDSGNLNDAVSALTGDQRVDAIFNGHSHSEYTDTMNGIPVVQSGGNGEYVGHVRLYFTDGSVSSFEADNIGKYNDPLLFETDPTVETLLNQYINETDDLFNDPIIISADYYSSSELSNWIAKLMREATGADIAFQNYGGTRTSIDNGEVISLAKLYQLWPFDNVIKTVSLDGSVINNLLFNLAYDTTITTFEAGTMYLVATNDYVFDKTSNPFLNGDNPTNTGILMRDLAEVELIAQAELFDDFDVDNPIQTGYQEPQVSPIAYKKEEDFFLFSIAHIEDDIPIVFDPLPGCHVLANFFHCFIV